MTEVRPTRVGLGLRDAIAHGPDKHLDGDSQTVTIGCTMPEGLYLRARSAGIVFSRLLQRAAEAELGGSDMAKIEAELEYHAEQTRILSAAKEQLAAKKKAEEEVMASKQARLDAIQSLADMFYSLGRERERRTPNLAWLKGRIQMAPALRGSTPEEILALILEAGGPREGPGGAP